MKRFLLSLLAVLALLAPARPAAASASSDAILLVAPSRYTVMQVAFDVARRYPTVLVSYQGSGDALALHVWDGTTWIPLTVSDYQSGSFLATYPGRVILVGGDDILPVETRKVSAWCDSVAQVPALETSGLVNGIGTILPFTPADWRWFAGRYNLTLRNVAEDEQLAARRENWYAEDGKVDDPEPGFFKYFTRARRQRIPAADKAPALRPVEVEEGEVVEVPAP
jgi:hypothetical protein